MLTTLFQDWLYDFDRQVGQKHRGQCILLLLDNCSSHKIEGLNLLNVDVYFLPPNITSKIQPMDSGIIMSFKNIIVIIIFDVIEADNIVHIETNDIEADDLLLNEISRMLEIINLPNSMGAKELLNIPEENIVYEVPEDITEFIEIFKKQSKENTNDLNNLDEMDDSTEVVTVSTNMALKSLNTVHIFLLQQENSNEQIKLVNTIKKFVRKKQTQTTIYQYFG
ncbi:unnamed protein product [Rhizophagus irregularis]|uniref:DDE-1 domain-containing protein n=1 Tax=Rhizophagus irregularis TaxID=588596 RepID=A0A915ZKG5_9GLOM|nr:unnamed protein product [Rhizophagus irregularis]